MLSSSLSPACFGRSPFRLFARPFQIIPGPTAVAVLLGVRTVRAIDVGLFVLCWHALSEPLCHFETTVPPGPQLCFIRRADLRGRG